MPKQKSQPQKQSERSGPRCSDISVFASIMRSFTSVLSASVLLLVAGGFSAARASGALLDTEWRGWKARHGRSYADISEESTRLSVWRDNYKMIAEHNMGNYTYQLSLNEFADMTQEEFRLFYLAESRAASEFPVSGVMHQMEDGGEEGMASVQGDGVDWRKSGYVTSVKNQGQCGSCWAFSATGALEAQSAKSTGSLVSLSEQQLVDCSWRYGNAGCNGGLMDYAFKYIKNFGYICSESDYPYLGYMWKCKANYCSKAATCSGYVDISSGSEDSLANAVANKGPVSVAIDASSYQFQFYSSGVYVDSNCSSDQLNHGVLVVGYDSGNNYDYWIVKNSWGSGWGDSGYIKMAKDQSNMCGIASAASYPTV